MLVGGSFLSTEPLNFVESYSSSTEAVIYGFAVAAEPRGLGFSTYDGEVGAVFNQQTVYGQQG